MDNVFNAALLGMLAANAVAVEKGNDCRLRSAEHTANVAEMVLCMAQSSAGVNKYPWIQEVEIWTGKKCA